MYNEVHRAQNQHLVLKLYIPVIYSLIGPNTYYIFSENLLNKLHGWI